MASYFLGVSLFIVDIAGAATHSCCDNFCVCLDGCYHVEGVLSLNADADFRFCHQIQLIDQHQQCVYPSSDNFLIGNFPTDDLNP